MHRWAFSYSFWRQKPKVFWAILHSVGWHQVKLKTNVELALIAASEISSISLAQSPLNRWQVHGELGAPWTRDGKTKTENDLITSCLRHWGGGLCSSWWSESKLLFYSKWTHDKILCYLQDWVKSWKPLSLLAFFFVFKKRHDLPHFFSFERKHRCPYLWKEFGTFLLQIVRCLSHQYIHQLVFLTLASLTSSYSVGTWLSVLFQVSRTVYSTYLLNYSQGLFCSQVSKKYKWVACNPELQYIILLLPDTNSNVRCWSLFSHICL